MHRCATWTERTPAARGRRWPPLAALVWLFGGGGALPAQQPDSSRTDSLPRAELPPLTVSATRSTTAGDRQPYAVGVVGWDAITRGRATLGLDEAIVTVPGVFVANRYNFSLDQRIAIRGFGARSAFGVRGIKVLVDGIPQTLPDGQGQLTNLELSEVDRIEVLRGAASTLFGNASGGVISVRTQLGAPERLDPAVRAVAGSHGLFKWHAGLAAPTGEGGVRFSFSRTTLNGFRDHSRADLRHASVRVGHGIGSGTQLTVLARADDMPLAQNPGALTRAELDSARTAADPRNVRTDAGKAVTQGQVGVAVRHVAPDGVQFEGAAFGIRRDLDNPLFFRVVGLDRWAYGWRSSARVPLRVRAGGAVTLGVDGQWQRDERVNLTVDRSRVVLDQLDRVSELGPFAHAEVHVSDRVTATAGVRYDEVRFAVTDRYLSDGDQSGTRTLAAASWMGGVALALGRVARPYASVGTSFETPTTTEFVNRPDGRAGLNPELEPQRAVHWELGMRGALGARVEYAVSAFQADVTDELIGFESPVEPGRQVFRNAGSSTHRGIEASVRLAPRAEVRVVAAYTLAHYRFDRFAEGAETFDGNRLPGLPQHRLHWSLEWDGPRGPWAALDNTYTSSVFADNTNAVGVPGWWVATVRAGWEGTFGRWRIGAFAAVENALDDRYVGSVVVNASGGRYFEPAPGRSFLLGVELR